MSRHQDSWLKRFGRSLTSAADEFVGFFSPAAGERRRQVRRGRQYLERRHQLRMQDIEHKGTFSGGAGFGSAEFGMDAHTWLKSRLSPDSALEWALDEMRARSNSAYKNYELFAGHVERRVNRVAGTGIMLAPQIVPVAGKISDDQAKEWNKQLRENFERWAHKAGGATKPLYMIQRMAERHVEKDGVAFVQFGDVEQNDPRIPVTLRLKVVHPRRVETPPEFAADPAVRLGVRRNLKTEDVKGYYVRTAHPEDGKDFSMDYDYVPAFFDNGLPRMVQIGEIREADQTIGYPQGQVALRRLKNAEEYEEAELERNIIAACYAGFGIGGDGDLAAMASAASSSTDASGRLIQELSPGRFVYVPNVEDFVFSTPPGPQGTYQSYVEHQGRMAAAGLGTSLEMMSGDWGGVSYSGGKLIWVDEQSPIDVGQLHLIELLLIPMWQHFVNRCVTGGIIDVLQSTYRAMPWIFERVKFVPPKRMSIDPARERSAARDDIAAGITVHSDEVEQMNGRPAEDVYEDIKRNNEQLTEIGLSLESLRAKGGTPLGGTNDETAEGSDGERKRREVGAAT
jgi:lambda family phage portal protein